MRRHVMQAVLDPAVGEPTAVVLDRRPGDHGKTQIRVGLRDGRIVPLALPEHVKEPGE